MSPATLSDDILHESPGAGVAHSRRSKRQCSRKGEGTASDRGRLKIRDDWNAIRIIALSQTTPLKAIAEFVENSIDAHARNVTITRGRHYGEHYLAIRDDGDAVPRGPKSACLLLRSQR